MQIPINCCDQAQASDNCCNSTSILNECCDGNILNKCCDDTNIRNVKDSLKDCCNETNILNICCNDTNNHDSQDFLKDCCNETNILHNCCNNTNIHENIKGSVKDCCDTPQTTENLEEKSENEICNFGQLQSPINLNLPTIVNKTEEFSANFDVNLSKINWVPFFEPHNFGIEAHYSNKPLDSFPPHILINSKLFNLSEEKYFLQNIHIHLSCEDNVMGSEHAVEFERFAAEVIFLL